MKISKTALLNFLASWSIVNRLTVLFSVSLTGILLLSSLILYISLENSFNNLGAQFLLNEVHLLKKLMQRYPQNLTPLKQEVLEEPNTIEGSRDHHYYVRILDSSGKTLIQTPGMGRLISPTVLAPNRRSNIVGRDKLEADEYLWTTRIDDKTYLLLTAQIPINADGDFRVIQLVLERYRMTRVLDEYRHTLVAVISLGFFGSVLLGFIITRRGIKPLRDITNALNKMSVTQLHERLTPSDWPKELVSLALAFNKMFAEIHEAFMRLRRFSEDLAHELRTPINNLMGEAEICLTRKRTSEEYQQVLESIMEEFSRLSNMIQGLLFLAHARNPEAVIQSTHVDAGKLMQSVRDFHEALAEEKNIKIECVGNGKIYADHMLLGRALNNLVSNALKYSRSGGQVTMRVNATPEGHTLSVADTGIGISAEHLPNLFERFYRVDHSRSQASGGLGLGLAIVKSIMDLHHGTVSITSEPNIGTTITLFFPHPATPT